MTEDSIEHYTGQGVNYLLKIISPLTQTLFILTQNAMALLKATFTKLTVFPLIWDVVFIGLEIS